MSSTTPSPVGRLRIRRARVDLLVPREHPEPERLRARLDAVLATELGPALARAMGPALAEARPGLWLLRRLPVAFETNTGWDGDAITRSWVKALARELRATVAAERTDDVRWFLDRATFVAQFLVDLAHGRAWGQWVYESFAGLRALSTSAALRTAITDGGRAWAILSAIDEQARSQVIAALTAGDAGRVLAVLAETDGTGNKLVARLARVVAEAGPAQAETILTAITEADLRAIDAPGVGAVEGLSHLARAESGCREAIARSLAARAGVRVQADAAPLGDVPTVAHTQFGGVFLLLPLLAEIPIEEATAHWPACGDTAPTAALRLLLMAQALGGERAAAFLDDPVARNLAGVGHRCDAGSLAAWAAALPSGAVQALSSTLTAWGRHTGALGIETLVLARAPLATGHRLVLLDGCRGQWVALGSIGRRRSRRLKVWFDRAVAPLVDGGRPGLAEVVAPGLLVDEGLVGAAEGRPWAWLRPLAAAENAPSADAPAGLSGVLARLPHLSDDLAYLAPPRAWDLRPRFAAATTVAAQALLRGFAWRIPGFAHASLRYLHANFLDARATIEDEPSRRVVRLGRPPLHLMLATTGMARATYRLRWTDDRPFTLFPSS